MTGYLFYGRHIVIPNLRGVIKVREIWSTLSLKTLCLLFLWDRRIAINVIPTFLSWEQAMKSEWKYSEIAKGSVASYFSVRRFVIGFVRHGPARRRKTGVNILRRDECSSAAVETSIRIPHGLIYDYANARNMKKVQTIMFLRSFLLPVLGENTDFINAMWLRLDFLYETLMREARRMKNNNTSYTECIKSRSFADSYRFFDKFRINFL